MKITDFWKKIEALCKKANIEIKSFRALALEAEVAADPRTLDTWKASADYTVRDKTAERLVEFFVDYGVRVTKEILLLPLEEFLRRIDVAPGPTKVDLSDLVETYQIIRPHTLRQAYVLEAMEIETANEHGEEETLFFSHNHPQQQYMYHGPSHAAKRYFFAFLKRMHEEASGDHSFRCISFYVGDTRCRHCLSGVMVRGMKGEQGKEVAGLPFIAIPMGKAHSLRSIAPVNIPKPSVGAEQLVRLHARGSILLGAVRADEYEELYRACDEVFQHEELGPLFTRKKKGLAVFSLPPSALLDHFHLKTERWVELVDALDVLGNGKLTGT